VKADGSYLYQATTHSLVRVSSADNRRAMGRQGFVGRAPLNLVYVADYRRMGGILDSQREHYASADVGFIGQNVYLFCTSAGLGTVIRGWVDRQAIAGVLGLHEDQQVLLSQTVGYPDQ